MKHVFMFALFTAFLAAGICLAQTNAAPPSTIPADREGRVIRSEAGRVGLPPVTSPEVLPDRRVVFRLRAPKATEVTLVGDLWPKQNVVERMTRDAEGVWSVTVGPLNPDVYGYSFIVDGVTLSDPSNGWIQPGVRSSLRSSFRIPGEQEAFLEVLPVPHGEVRIVYFEAESLGKIRRMHSYLPPGYDTGKVHYPVLYLIHGAGEDDSGWITVGLANIILDNLIAQGKAKPMIVVMPSYQGLASGSTAGMIQQNYPIFARHFAQDILPFVERTYRVIAKPEGRAFGGLSPPDVVPDTLIPILDKFNYWLCTSNGLREARMAFYDKQFPGVLNNPVNSRRVKLLIGDGSNAMTFTEATYMASEFKRRGYDVTFYQTEGTHSFPWFRRYLNELAPKLFR